MPRWQIIGHWFGFSVLSLLLTAFALFNLNLLYQAVIHPSNRSLALAGLLMLCVCCLGIGSTAWFLRRLIEEFSYDGRALRFSTLGISQMQLRDISEVAEVGEWKGRNGPQGYRIRFRDGQKIYLQYGVSNAMAAAEQIRRDAGRYHKTSPLS